MYRTILRGGRVYLTGRCDALVAAERAYRECSEPQLVATTEGTHGGPDHIRIYECLDGTRIGRAYHAGSECGSVSLTVTPRRGLLRTILSESAASRRSRLPRLAADLERAKQLDAAERLAAGWDGLRYVGAGAATAQ